MNNQKTLITLLLATCLSLGLVGCDRDGPAEEAGEDIDRAMDDAGDQLERTGDKIDDATDK